MLSSFYRTILRPSSRSIRVFSSPIPFNQRTLYNFHGVPTRRTYIDLKPGVANDSVLKKIPSDSPDQVQIFRKWDNLNGAAGFVGFFDQETLDTLRGLPEVAGIEEEKPPGHIC